MHNPLETGVKLLSVESMVKHKQRIQDESSPDWSIIEEMKWDDFVRENRCRGAAAEKTKHECTFSGDKCWTEGQVLTQYVLSKICRSYVMRCGSVGLRAYASLRLA
jgi:hypothetical protein